MSDQPPIEIQLFGHGAMVSAEFAPLITALLERPIRQFVRGGPWGYRQVESTIDYWGLNDGDLFFLAGHVQRVKQHLEALGHCVQIVNRTHWEHLAQANTKLLEIERQGTARGDALLALTQNPRGQLRVADVDEVPHTLALMSRLFERENILVLAKNRKIANWLAAEVGALTDRPVDLDFSIAKHRRPRLLIVTSELASMIGGDDFNVIVHADVESALREGNDPLQRLGPLKKPDYRSSLLARWRNCAMYLVCDAHRQPTPTEEFRLEAHFGPVIFSVYESGPRRDIAVAFVPIEGQNGRRRTAGLERKRQYYWHNQSWNARIATIARQVADGEWPFELPADLTLMPSPWISIVVESEEHGAELQRHLPDWPLLTLRDPQAAEQVPERPHRQIVTLLHAAEHGLESDVIIRADGGEGWPLAGVLEQAPQVPHSRLVIDLNDQRDQQCIEHTTTRLQAYQRAGWWTLPMSVELPLGEAEWPASPEHIADTVSATAGASCK